MPRFPRHAASVESIRGSVFSSLAHRLRDFAGETYPLHVGDTWMEPPAGCRMEDLTVAENPGMHRYAPPHGLPALVEAVARRTEARTGVATRGDEVLLAAGATGALGAVMGALLDGGDEVLVLAPYWPLIAGIVRSFHATPVPVPFYGAAASDEEAVALVAARLTGRTAALYLNTPNNPTGRVVPPEQVEALVRWAAGAGLWVVSDEVYEDYVYRGRHAYARAAAPERTFSAYSFSKGYGMAGNRCGYVVGPAAAMLEVRKVSTHTFYSAPTASQLAALRCLDGPGDAWVAAARKEYRRLGDAAAARLGVEPPEGSTFLFLDVAERLDERGLMGFLEDCVERGLFLAPGPSFGPYPTHVRVCFTSTEPARVERGVEVLAQVLGR
jgi:N-succinyldiaminopimelate aminotransferase